MPFIHRRAGTLLVWLGLGLEAFVPQESEDWNRVLVIQEIGKARRLNIGCAEESCRRTKSRTWESGNMYWDDFVKEYHNQG
jgi:hypothetical protein